MGGCIKALLSGSRGEEIEITTFHSSPGRQYHISRDTNGETKPAPPRTVGTQQERNRTQQKVSSRRLDPSVKNRNGVSLDDINSANSHQLCVLARLSPDQAQAVVNYRVNVCGGKFSHFEQLLQVPGGGISPEKLKFMGVSIRDYTGHLVKNKESSATSPLKQRTHHDLSEPSTETALLDFINSANYHQLCVLLRISDEQAKAVVDYRVYQCGGRLDTIEQLLDTGAGGITVDKLQRIVGSKSVLVHPSPPIKQSTPRKRQTRPRPVVKMPVPLSPIQPTALFKLPAGVLHIGDDINVPKHKPSKGEKFIRIGSWNLECFTTKKVSNLGVLEVVCMTILMNGFDVMAFQELGDDQAIKKVCEELNNPTLMKVQGWSSINGKWKCAVSEKTGRMFQGMEYNAFLWNESSGISMMSCGLVNKQRTVPDDLYFVRKPFAGTFKTSDWTFTLISLHLKAAGWNGEHAERVQSEVNLLSPLLQATIEAINGKLDVILLGDFNMSPDDSSFSPLYNQGYLPILSPGEPTNISAANLKGSHSYDNVWVDRKVHSERYAGLYKIVRRGLQHQLIEGKKPGTPGTVSDHCPIWVSFSTK